MSDDVSFRDPTAADCGLIDEIGALERLFPRNETHEDEDLFRIGPLKE